MARRRIGPRQIVFEDRLSRRGQRDRTFADRRPALRATDDEQGACQRKRTFPPDGLHDSLFPKPGSADRRGRVDPARPFVDVGELFLSEKMLCTTMRAPPWLPGA